jgi:ATP-binding cassette subfamily B multidrug efflux pump
MLRLIKYLKPYALLIILSIGLLFIQANADLALPDYLSKIVNNGIQQSGVENAVPEAIRQIEMDKLFIFMSAEEKTLVLNDYLLVEPTSPDADQYLQQYPALADVSIYVLKDVDRTEIDVLKPIMGKALVVVSGIEQMIADPSKAPLMGEGFDFDLSQIPPGMDVFELLGMIPAERLSEMSTRINEMFVALGDSMINQMAVSAVKTEYEALGMDTANLRTEYILRTGAIMLLI